MDDRQLEQTQEERLVGLDYDPSLSWSFHKTNLRKKKLFNASIEPILEYCVSVWGSCNAGLLDEIFKVQKRCARVILDAPFQARILPLFLELGWLPINQICIERRLLLLNKILDGCAPDYLSEKLLPLKYHKSHDTRSLITSLFHVPIA